MNISVIPSAEWVVLDNIKQHWDYRTGLTLDIAKAAYDNVVSKGLIEDSKLTDKGEIALIRGYYD